MYPLHRLVACACLPAHELTALWCYGRDTASIVEFATREWSAQAPPPQVTQLTDQAVLQTECIGFNEPGLEKVGATPCFLLRRCM